MDEVLSASGPVIDPVAGFWLTDCCQRPEWVTRGDAFQAQRRLMPPPASDLIGRQKEQIKISAIIGFSGQLKSSNSEDIWSTRHATILGRHAVPGELTAISSC